MIPHPRILLPAFLLAVLGAAPAAAQGQTEAVARLRPTPPMTQWFETGTAVAMNHVTGRTVVDVRVNGAGPFPFRLDTGTAGHGSIDASLVDRFGLTVAGQVRTSGRDGRRRTTQLVNLDSLTLGDVSFAGLTLAVTDEEDRPRRREPDTLGTLGFGLFTGGILTLDYPASELRFGRRTGLDPAASFVVPYETDQGVPQVRIVLGELQPLADIDTGTRESLVLPLSFVEKLGLSRPPGSLLLGGHLRRLPEIHFDEEIRTPRVGYEALRDLRITFDPAARLVRFEKSAAADSADRGRN